MSARDHILQVLIDDAWLGYAGEGEPEGLSSDDLYGIADAILASAWLAEHDRKVKAEGHREGCQTARADLLSGAFVGGPTYEALRDSFTGRRVQVEALRGVAAELPVLTEGKSRVGTAWWSERDRDTYSLAIEEACAAINARADRIEADDA